MRRIFADTGYWIALTNPLDGLHRRALTISQQLGACHIVTSDVVLTELLNAFAERGVHLRQAAVEAATAINEAPNVEVVPQSRDLFVAALEIYKRYGDKDWSLTDCASFVIMSHDQLAEALTHDRHFEQMGHTALLRN